MAKLLRVLNGYLWVCIRGGKTERFINLCAARGILLWDVVSQGNKLFFNVKLKQFYDLRPLVRKTRVRVVIQKRMGLPFLMPKIYGRWPFFVAAATAITIWICSSCFLWNVEFCGNVKVTEDQLQDFLRERGVHSGIAIRKIDLSFLERELMRTFPDLTWTSMTIKGTKLFVSVKENDVPIIQEKEKHVGMELVSPAEGIVVSMIVRSGIPKVKMGDVVKEGQVLISGLVPIMGDDGTTMDWMEVEADGDVWIERIRYFEDSVSFEYLDRQMTGRMSKELFLKIGDNCLFGRKKKSYYRENVLETEVTPSSLKWFGLPIQVMEIRHVEWLPTICKRDEEGGREILEKKMSSFQTSLEEKGIQIIDKNVKIDAEGDFWLLICKFVTLEKADVFRNSEKGVDGSDD